MDKQKIITELKDKFSFIVEDDRILGLFLFGSIATDNHTTSSDIDLCFIVPDKSQLLSVYNWIMEHAANFRDEYDYRFFEEFPLHVKIRVIEEGIPIIGKDIPAVYEYFWIYRKLWEDYKFTLAKA